MKVVERIFEHRIRQQIEVDDMQFEFMKGKGTTDAIFTVRQVQENFRVKGKALYFGFVDLEKAFDRVPREVIQWAWAVHKLGVKEWLVSAVVSVYTGAKTVVRTVYGISNGFEVKVGMRQGSALSPLVIVMEAISREFRVTLLWELLYADDLLVIAETEEDLIKRLNEWKNNVENRGMRVNMNKTKVMISGERQKPVQKAARWPSGVCVRGVGSNSIQCTSCQKWVYKKCSRIKGSTGYVQSDEVIYL